jgi:hypothetical protein
MAIFKRKMSILQMDIFKRKWLFLSGQPDPQQKVIYSIVDRTVSIWLVFMDFPKKIIIVILKFS